MNGYAPRMDEIRKWAITGAVAEGYVPHISATEFDRWLAAHDAEVKAEAWDEGWNSGTSRAMRRMSDEPTLPLKPTNPYRAAEIADNPTTKEEQ